MARVYGQAKENDDSNSSSTAPPVDRKPDAQTVTDFHTFADTDSRDTAIHHTLGVGPTQASPGDHNHDGGDSVLLLEGMVITGNKANAPTVFPSIIQALVRLGAKDATT